MIEWLAVCLSGQVQKYQKPHKFSNFLESRKSISNGWTYPESGYFIDYLFKTYWKEKLLELITARRDEITSDEQFMAKFIEIYGFELTYEEINKRFK